MEIGNSKKPVALAADAISCGSACILPREALIAISQILAALTWIALVGSTIAAAVDFGSSRGFDKAQISACVSSSSLISSLRTPRGFPRAAAHRSRAPPVFCRPGRRAYVASIWFPLERGAPRGGRGG